MANGVKSGLRVAVHRIAAAASAAVVLLTALPVTASAAMSADTALRNATWNDYADKKMEDDKTPGMVLTLVSGDETGYRSWGKSDLKDNIPIDKTTPVHIGSCSQTFTALAVLLLQEEGKLSVKENVSEYIPWWEVQYARHPYDVTISHLLQGLSGIPYSTLQKVPYGTEREQLEETARIAEGIELVVPPGREFIDCDLNFDILAYLVETVSGKPFEQFMEEEIFLPLGMKNTGYDIPSSQGYSKFYGKVREYDAPEHIGNWGNSGIISTAEDMSYWIQAQLGRADIPEALENAIKKSQKPMDEELAEKIEGFEDFSMGWINYNSVLSSQGAYPNFAAYMLIDTENDVGIFSACNIWADTACDTAIALSDTMEGDTIDRRSSTDMPTVADKVGKFLTIISAILIILAVRAMLAQPKRVKKAHGSELSEFIFMVVKCVFLTVVGLVYLFMPTLIGSLTDFGKITYRFANEWLPHSLVIGHFLFGGAIVFLIISTITRYIAVKHAIRTIAE